MKNSIAVIIILIFLSVVLFATNPGIEDHRTAVFEKVQEKVNASVPDMFSGNQWVDQGKKLGFSFLKVVISKVIVRDDYGLFSITKVTYPTNKNIGIGIMGRVFVFTDFDPSKGNITSTQDDMERFESEVEAIDTTVAEVPARPIESENYPSYRPGYYFAESSPEGKIFFHNEPDEQTRRNAFLVEGDEVNVEKVVRDFGYVEFTNSRGKVTKGWVKMQYLKHYDIFD